MHENESHLIRTCCVVFIFLYSFCMFDYAYTYDFQDALKKQFDLEINTNASRTMFHLKNEHFQMSYAYGSPFIQVNNHYLYLNSILEGQDVLLDLRDETIGHILAVFSDNLNSYSYIDGSIIAEKKKPTQNAEQFIYTQKPKKLIIEAIVIDAGHGGKDPGTFRGDAIEKNITLATALQLEKKLKALFPKKKIIMTRRNDVFVSLDNRARTANDSMNKFGQTLFISIHVNASVSTVPYGFETWYIVNDYSRKIIDEKANISDKMVASILNSMANDEVYTDSKELAELIQKELNFQIGDVSKNRGVKENTYIVVKNSLMPAVLVEIGFLSNKYEAKRLTNQQYLLKIVHGITKGIEKFVEDYESMRNN